LKRNFSDEVKSGFGKVPRIADNLSHAWKEPGERVFKKMQSSWMLPGIEQMMDESGKWSGILYSVSLCMKSSL
jgi:hypothetical protein